MGTNTFGATVQSIKLFGGIALALHKTPHIINAFQKGYLAYFGPPTHIICDQDPAFTFSLMEAFSSQLNIKLIMVSPTNHKSLQVEHGMKSLSWNEKFIRIVSQVPL